MTQFWRDGFWRTNAYGNTHWVTGHLVGRDIWDRDRSYSTARAWIESARAALSATARYINPNADCPVCGLPVFFYQNEHGSRVYFDELGPPWPKHLCTDQSSSRGTNESGALDRISPTTRDPIEVSHICNLLTRLGQDPANEFKQKYGLAEWGCWQVGRRFKSGSSVLLVLISIATTETRRLFLSVPRLPRFIDRGSTVFFRRNHLAYFDLAAMQPAEMAAQRIRSVGEFVEELVASDELNGSCL